MVLAVPTVLQDMFLGLEHITILLVLPKTVLRFTYMTNKYGLIVSLFQFLFQFICRSVSVRRGFRQGLDFFLLSQGHGKYFEVGRGGGGTSPGVPKVIPTQK